MLNSFLFYCNCVEWILWRTCLTFLHFLQISSNSGEWETLVLGHHTIINDFLFIEFFCSEIIGDTLFMRDNVWTDEFETSFENANV